MILYHQAGSAPLLAITHRLVLVMGGNLNGESELGVGSTFTLRLPADMKTHLDKPHVLKASNLFIRDILNRPAAASRRGNWQELIKPS